MKQFITLGEISRDLGSNNHKVDEVHKYLDKSYNLTIGGMIEFLDNNNSISLKELLNHWDDGGVEFFKAEKWCDILWEEIKEIQRMKGNTHAKKQ